MTESAEVLVYTAPGAAEIRPVALPPLGPGMVEVRTRHSALSRGTERLVLEGRVPESEWQTMRAPFQQGEFPFPVAHGYAAAGVVEAGPGDLLGREVFALHPHQTRFRLPAGAVVPLPEGVPAARAVLGANAETALNAIWDAELRPGARVLVLGAGLVGCLIAGLLSRRADLAVTVADIDPSRAAVISSFGVAFQSPDDLSDDHDTVFHTTASAAGLQTALDSLAFEGKAIELSWYGSRPVSVGLGGRFHSRRLSIVCSQVGHVAPSRRASTSHHDRLSAAIGQLGDPRFDALVTESCRFRDLPGSIGRLLAPDAPGIATRIDYD
jgi:2-desacetyl-2-hydroxyethyl bacteriochlorophyllide A dehydrogenase